MGVSKNNGTLKSSILIGFSIIFTIHFGVPLFLETPMLYQLTKKREASNPQTPTRNRTETKPSLELLEPRMSSCFEI